MKKGTIGAGSFQRNDKEPFNGVFVTVYDEEGKIIVDIELTFEQYGKLISGRGVDMKYKEYKQEGDK